MQRSYFIGYDLGTSGVKTVLVEPNGRIISSEFSAYASFSPLPSWHEQNPDDWWRAICRTTRKVMRSSHISASKVRGISFGVQGIGLVPVDENVRPLARCMTWLDSRSQTQAQRITEETGIEVSSKDVPAKALWLKENKPRIFEKASKLLDCGAYLIAKFTGNFAWAVENAKWFGFDEANHRWRYEDYGLSESKVPKVVSAADVAGETSLTSSSQLGVETSVPVVAGGSDVTSAVIGSGAVKAGGTHVYLGSSAWVGRVFQERIDTGRGPLPSIFTVKPFDKWFVVGESESACACLEWFLDAIGMGRTGKGRKSSSTRYRAVDLMIARIPAGSANLIFVPWMKGERAPVMDDCARGAFMGLTFLHAKEHLARSVLEGVAYNMRWVLERIEQCGSESSGSYLRAVGGGFNSRAWAQIFADVLAKEIHVVRQPQFAGAVGAAMIAALGTKHYKQLDELDGLLPSSFKAKPNRQNRSTYDKMYSSFKHSYPEEIAQIYRQWGPS